MVWTRWPIPFRRARGRAGSGGGRRVAAAPFLAGVLCAFLACCVAGRVVASTNFYENFVRFHMWISPQAQYYPTASQLRALGRSRLDGDKVAVVVGGNSILHGHNPGPLWTKRLQEDLGDRFQVINFAIPSALPSEFGGVAAEMLERDHPRLLFVTDCGSSTLNTTPDGYVCRNVFWDAYYKGLISSYPARDARLREEAKARAKEGPAFAELQRGEWLHAGVRFDDLWTAVTYTHVGAVWTPLTAANFLKPRRRYVEVDVTEPPVEQRYAPQLNGQSMAILRELTATGAALSREAPGGGTYFAHCLNDCFSESSRRRTLMLVTRDSPHYVAQLGPGDRAAYDAVFPALVRALEDDGLAALDVGRGYAEADYFDRCHFSDQGGRRMADDVAPKVKELAQKLGYVP